jgi:protein gp37
MGASKIEWTEETWNPIAGCSILSPGCHHCYAMRLAARLAAMGQAKYAGTTQDSRWTGRINFDEAALSIPLKKRKPKMWFVNSMSDLFHESVPFEFVDRVFAVMNATYFTLPINDRSKRWHTYQVLTKRADRMAEYILSRSGKFRQGKHPIFVAGREEGGVLCGQGMEIMNAGACLQWPLPNVWLGVSVEDQKRADERIPHLLRCPAAVRFLSVEPLLGPIDFVHTPASVGGAFLGTTLPGLHWLIVGGESGHGARPMHPGWVRSIRDQCQAAGVPFFFKQWGAWMPLRDEPTHSDPRDFPGLSCDAEGCSTNGNIWALKHNGIRRLLKLVGKKDAGRQLDGREWNEMPEVAA